MEEPLVTPSQNVEATQEQELAADVGAEVHIQAA